MSSIPPPSSADRERDAREDYPKLEALAEIAIHAGWALPWLRRAVAAEGEATALRAQIEGHCKRIADQSDQLSQNAERAKGRIQAATQAMQSLITYIHDGPDELWTAGALADQVESVLAKLNGIRGE